MTVRRPAMNAVFDHSAAEGTALLVLLAIARHGRHDGTGAYPSIDTIAAMVKVSRSTVIRTIDDLNKAGELEVDRRAGPKAANVYVVVVAARGGSVKSPPDGVTAMTPPSSGTAMTPPDEGAVSSEATSGVKPAGG